MSLAAAMASGTTSPRRSVRAEASAWEVVDLVVMTETISDDEKAIGARSGI